jgi:hypothetical protein
MNKTVIIILLCGLSAPASPVATVEGVRTSEKVTYSKNTNAEVVCTKIATCEVNINLHGRKYKIDQKKLGPEYLILPSQLALLYENDKKYTTYSVQFEVACKEYSDNKTYICIATVNMDASKILNISTFQRVYHDVYTVKKSEDSQK